VVCGVQVVWLATAWVSPLPLLDCILPACAVLHPAACPLRSLPPYSCALQVCEALAAGCERPLILPLSRKSADGRLEASEVEPTDALAWTQVGLWGGAEGSTPAG